MPKLTDLSPQFLKRTDDTHFQNVDTLAQADGIEFLCPKCFVKNQGRVGTHAIICWQPHVPQTTSPTPGRWSFSGTGYSDLTLSAQSSSIALRGGCAWHGFVENGTVRDA